MKRTTLKLTSIILMGLFVLAGCLSSESPAESISQESSTQKSSTQKNIVKESSVQESGTQENTVKESSTQGNSTQENNAKESSTQENSTQENSTQQGSSQESNTASIESAFEEGKHYFEIFPEMNTNVSGDNIEVLELFWLGCPHCNALEPAIKAFVKTKPDDVAFSQVPAVLNPQWSFHAKAFYTGKVLDPQNKKHLLDKLFNEIHEKNNRLNTPKKLKQFFVDQGYSDTDFNNAFNSMALNAAMSNAQTVSANSQATSVPTLIINGKYRTSPYSAGGEENLMKIVNMLIERERK